MIKHTTITGILFYTLISGISLMATSCIQPLLPSPDPTFTYYDIREIVGIPIKSVAPTWENSPPNATYTYTIDPALPAGLNINEGTGTISGTPRTTHISTTYTITAISNAISSIIYSATMTILVQTEPATKDALRKAITDEITRQKAISPNLPPDLSTINTSKIADMSKLFKGDTTFNSDISTLDVSNVTNMSAMFSCMVKENTDACVDPMIFNQDISKWDVSNVTDMSYMFRGATTFNQDISKWNVSSVTDMSSMFEEAAAFNQNLSDWSEHLQDTVTQINMFKNSDIGIAQENIPSWFPVLAYKDIIAIIENNTQITVSPSWVNSSPTISSYHIDPALPLPEGLNIDKETGIISGTPTTPQLSTAYTITATDNNDDTYTTTITILVQTKPVTKEALTTAIDNEITRQKAISPNLPPNLSTINTSKITDMSELFKDKVTFNGDISTWDVSKVTDMEAMFHEATAFNQDISKWNVEKVGNMRYMFFQATAFNQDISKWNVSSVTDMSSMFNKATAFNQNISGWNVGNVQDMNSMFNEATAFNQNISGWNVGNVQDMNAMFQGATAFNQDLEAWGTHLKDRTVEKTDMFQNSGLAAKPSWCDASCYTDRQAVNRNTRISHEN